MVFGNGINLSSHKGYSRSTWSMLCKEKVQLHVKSLRELAKITLSRRDQLWSDCLYPPSTTMSCTPLTPISGNSSCRKKLTPYERELIVGRSSRGASTAEIRKEFLVPESTIRSTISQAPLLNHSVSKLWSGCSKCCSLCEQRHIIHTAQVKPEITYQELIKLMGVNCSKSTVYWILKKYELTNWLVKKRSLLQKENAAKRLAWVKERKDWTDNDWVKVIWTNKCSVKWSTGKSRKWVFQTSADKWKRENIQAVSKGKDVSVMVWEAFWGRERSELNKMERDSLTKKNEYSAQFYVKILEDNLLEIWTLSLIFMYDNASIHNAGTVKLWLEEHGISLMKWPFYSPDLNSIEHL